VKDTFVDMDMEFQKRWTWSLGHNNSPKSRCRCELSQMCYKWLWHIEEELVICSK